jgi:methylmalonyl-CoA mutase
MASETPLFSDFPAVSKAEWFARMEKDLRGKPLHDMRWHLSKDIILEPAYHPEDRPEPRPPLRSQPGWQVGEYVSLDELPDARNRLLEGLQGGVEAPVLRFKRTFSDAEWDQMLDGLLPDAVSVHLEELYSRKQPQALLSQWHGWLKRHGHDPQRIKGTIDVDPLLDESEPDFDALKDIVQQCRKELPGYRCVQVNARIFHGAIQAVEQELALTLAKANEYLVQLTERGLTPGQVVDRMHLSLAVGTSYFVEIAKLRALRLLWPSLMQGHGANGLPMPSMAVHLAMESQSESDMYANMIQASTQVMSAVLGGADLIFVLPANANLKEASTGFTRRIARNVQHILKLEAHLDQVADPLAGSYFVEELTDVLARKAWKLFREFEADGGYMESSLI